MAHAPAAILRHIRTLASAPAAERSDRELLQGFATTRDEAAFTALVRRHGALVLSVCRHVLRHEQDAEDAFQATFLVLARKAASLQKTEAVGGWLFGVAYRTAMNVRNRAARRRARDQRAEARSPAGPVAEASLHELQALLDAEVARLPEKLRLPFVACCLEGRTKAEAARDLGLKEGTVSSRLALARERLRDRLTRRGVTFSAALTALGLEQRASAAVPATLTVATVRSALAPHSIQPNIAANARDYLTTSLRCKWAVAGVLLAGLLAGGGVLGEWLTANKKGGERANQTATKPKSSADGDKPTMDPDGNPLPEGALLRLGSLRLRHRDSLRSVAFAPDGKLLASAGRDGTIRLWDPATGKEVRQIVGPKDGLNCIAYSPDGKLIAGAGGDHLVHLWNAATGSEVRRLKCGADVEQRQLQVVAFSPKGDQLVAGDTGAVRLWEVATGNALHVFDIKEGGGVWLAEFSPDGRRLVAGAGDTTVRIWDIQSGQQLHHLKRHDKHFHSVAFSKDGKTLVTATSGEVLLWDAASGKPVDPPGGQPILGDLAVFSPDGTILAVTGGKVAGHRMIHLWDWKTGKELREIRGRADWVRNLAFSPDGKTLAAASSESAIHLWDVATGKPRLATSGHVERVSSVGYSPDGKTIATAAWDGSVRLWSAKTGVEIRRLQADTDIQSPPYPLDMAGLSHVAFFPDGKRLAIVRGDKVALVWDIATGKELLRFYAECVAFSPDGKLVACGGQGTTGADANLGLVRLHDAATGKVVRELRGHLTTVASVTFAPDGKTLYSRGYVLEGAHVAGEPGLQEKKFVRAWDVATGKEIRAFPGADRIYGVAVSPDGRTLAGGDMEGKTITLYETATGAKRAKLNGYEGMIFGVAFAPDGRTLASAGMDGTMRLWDLPSCKQIAKLEGHRGWVLSVAFSPDGTQLVSSSIDTTALVWDVSRLAKRRTTPVELPARALESCWTDLAGDAAKAYRAVASLTESSAQATALLRDRLHAAAAPDERRIARLIADLDSDEFAVRQQAAAELEKVAELAEPTLRKALNDNPSTETKRRLDALLAKLDTGDLPASGLRDVRALEVLEHFATPEARRLLQGLAKGLPQARLSREAKAALERLAKRPTAAP